MSKGAFMGPEGISGLRAHHDALADPSFGDLLLVIGVHGSDPVIAVDALGESIVVRTIDRHEARRAGSVLRRRRREIVALEEPALGSGILRAFQPAAFGGIGGVEVRVWSVDLARRGIGARVAVEA